MSIVFTGGRGQRLHATTLRLHPSRAAGRAPVHEFPPRWLRQSRIECSLGISPCTLDGKSFGVDVGTHCQPVSANNVLETLVTVALPACGHHQPGLSGKFSTRRSFGSSLIVAGCRAELAHDAVFTSPEFGGDSSTPQSAGCASLLLAFGQRPSPRI